MRNQLKVGIIVGFVIGILFSAGAIVLAGNLAPPGGPTDPNSQMYTLQQIYDQLATGAAGEIMTGPTEPSSGPGTSTMVTLNEIMAVAPVTHSNAATQTYIVSGTVVWGLSENAWGVITGTLPYLPVPKTGQTVCFRTVSPFVECECGTANCPAGVDGDLQMGVDPLNPRFTDNANGTVTDNMTGLIWLENANCPGTADGRDWYTALANVAELNATGGMTGTDTVWRDCGDTSNNGSYQTDWRLPNVRELHSLVDYGQDYPPLPSGHPFDNVWPRWYWTSTTHITYPANAFFVSMWGARVYHIGKNAIDGGEEDYRLYVWPVRGGQ
jgi:hypothetical protein